MQRIDQNDLQKNDLEYYNKFQTASSAESRIIILRETIQKYPGFVHARLNLALTYCNEEIYHEAIRIYQDVLNDFLDEKGAIAGIALVHFETGNMEKAEIMAKKALGKGYIWSPLYRVLAETHEKRGKIKDALDYYLKAYQNSPHSWNNLEQYCRLKGRAFYSPLGNDAPTPISIEQLDELLDYVYERILDPEDEEKGMTGCGHTFRCATEWAETNEVDLISLYQFLMCHGGFCDCELIHNVSGMIDEREKVN